MMPIHRRSGEAYIPTKREKKRAKKNMRHDAGDPQPHNGLQSGIRKRSGVRNPLRIFYSTIVLS